VNKATESLREAENGTDYDAMDDNVPYRFAQPAQLLGRRR